MVTKLTYGSGLGEGISSLGASIGQALKERTQRKLEQDILNPKQENPKQDPTESEGFKSEFLNLIKGYEDKTGTNLSPEQLDLAWNESVKKTQSQQNQSQKGTYTPRYNIAQLATIARKNPKLAKMIQDDQFQKEKMAQAERIAGIKGEQKSQLEKDKRTFASNKEYLTGINKTRNSLIKREATLSSISDIIGKGDLKTLQNFAADYLGNKGYSSEFLKSANANDLDAAVKNEFIADAQSLPGAKLNQYVDRLFKQSLQSPLKSPENNLRITEMQRFLLDVDKKKVEIVDKIIDQYETAGLEPPANLMSKVEKELKPYAQDKLKDLTTLYHDIDSGKVKAKSRLNLEVAKDRIKNVSPKEGYIWMIFGDNGVPKQVPVKDSAKWQKSGGTLIR